MTVLDTLIADRGAILDTEYQKRVNKISWKFQYEGPISEEYALTFLQFEIVGQQQITALACCSLLNL